MVKNNRVPKLQIDLICKFEVILKNRCFSCETPKYLPLAVNYIILICPPKQFHEHKVDSQKNGINRQWLWSHLSRILLSRDV